jgi:hypothetical protein
MTTVFPAEARRGFGGHVGGHHVGRNVGHYAHRNVGHYAHRNVGHYAGKDVGITLAVMTMAIAMAATTAAQDAGLTDSGWPPE